MSPSAALAAVLGAGLGFGFWLFFTRLPVLRPRSFADRIAPQLRSVEHGSRLLDPAARDVTPFGPLERILRPLLHDAVRRLNRLNPVASGLRRRLEQAGRGQTPLDFRAEQVIWGGAGLLAGGFLTVLLAAAGRTGVVGVLVGTLACSVLAFLFRDYLLTVQIRKRSARILAEFPSLAEMMALAVGAGESAGGALERVARTAQGELAGEFGRVLAETRSGVPLVAALHNLSNRVQLPPLVRFVDGITVAVERGTPLGDVMRAQAQDVRDLAKRELMETAGKKEIAMMIPLVFGVLPLTVLFAVFPGLALLRLGL